MNKKILSELLKAGIAEAGWKEIAASESTQAKLIDYIELLYKWNSVHNLTGIKEPEEMVKRHVLDSLVLLPYLSDGSVVDVGTGAGVPGIPLAISQPLQSFVLIDSNQKKINFVQQVILSLKLTNVTVVCTRVEAYQPTELFDFVVSRAFASLPEFIRLAGHLCKPEGRLIAMKGSLESAETAVVQLGYIIEKTQPVFVPGLQAKRSLVFVKLDKQEI